MKIPCPMHGGRHQAYLHPPYYTVDGYHFACFEKYKHRQTLERFMSRGPGPPYRAVEVQMAVLSADEVTPHLNLAMLCSRCDRPGTSLEDSRTEYVDQERNKPVWLCVQCAADHHTYWDTHDQL